MYPTLCNPDSESSFSLTPLGGGGPPSSNSRFILGMLNSTSTWSRSAPILESAAPTRPSVGNLAFAYGDSDIFPLKASAHPPPGAENVLRWQA